jgi:release factor glutamine methyltransferase
MAAQRVSGLPLEQVIGWAEFCGLRIAVEPGVFVPRRRTEFLVQQAQLLARPGDIIVDLCCGAGAIAAALAATVPGARVHAADVNSAAVRCARRNLPGADVYLGDLFDPLPGALRGHIAILTANVPYVPTAEIPLLPVEARLHEPRASLDGGPDGLDVLRRVAAAAPDWLAAGGHLLSETSEAQAPAAAAVLAAVGLTPQVVHSDELYATVITGRA